MVQCRFAIKKVTLKLKTGGDGGGHVRQLTIDSKSLSASLSVCLSMCLFGTILLLSYGSVGGPVSIKRPFDIEYPEGALRHVS